MVAAKDTSELFGLAREIISITARMAAETTRRMRLVEDSTGDWAVTIIGRSVTHTQAILDKFHTNQVRIAAADLNDCRIDNITTEFPNDKENRHWGGIYGMVDSCRRAVVHETSYGMVGGSKSGSKDKV